MVAEAMRDTSDRGLHCVIEAWWSEHLDTSFVSVEEIARIGNGAACCVRSEAVVTERPEIERRTVYATPKQGADFDLLETNRT